MRSLAAGAARRGGAGGGAAEPRCRPITGTRLDVVATGEVTRVPDIVRINAGVVTQAPTAVEAIRQNARADGARCARRCARAGIAERDIQTSSINLNPDYRYAENQPPQLIGYQAINQVSVRFRDIAKTGAILDALVAAGRQPDQRADADDRAARGGARRGADRGARQCPGPGRALCARARHAGGADPRDQRGRRGCMPPPRPVMRDAGERCGGHADRAGRADARR